jgi:hypothetical protein
MKLRQILNPQFQEAFRDLTSQEMPARVAFMIHMVKKDIYSAFDLYKECYKAALEKYADKNPDGTCKQDEDENYILSDENRTRFVHEINDLLEQEIEVRKIDTDIFTSFDVKISADKLMILSGIFT